MIWRTASAAVACFAAVSLASCQTVPSPEPLQAVDTIITGGLVFDGSGADGAEIDVAIDEGYIIFTGPSASSQYSAETIIEATGKIVAPGFIDPHTHAGSNLASDDAKRRANAPYIFQGVTTVMVGNDGFGTPDIALQAEVAGSQGIGTNVAYLAGFGPIRESALGKENRAPTAAELSQMKALTRNAMCEGAWGLSAGLYYVPQNYAKTDEVIALAKIAAQHGGYYDTHLRDESTYNITVTGAVEEALSIGKAADIPVHIAHIKALGPAVWGHSSKMITAIEAARANGQRVTADQYPWTASGTRISNAIVPRWALEGGLSGLRKRLANTATRSTIRAEMLRGLERRGGADKLLITGRLGDARVATGQTLQQLADAQGVDAVDAAIAVLTVGDARVASFNMAPADIVAFAAQEWVVTGSDGSTGHPRKYASFPKAYQDFVVGSGTMNLARFIRRSSGQTADLIGLSGRGYLRQDYAADIVIFDPAEFAPVADYQNPRLLSAGVHTLLVNGEAVISNGTATGALPGQPLLKDTECFEASGS